MAYPRRGGYSTAAAGNDNRLTVSLSPAELQNLQSLLQGSNANITIDIDTLNYTSDNSTFTPSPTFQRSAFTPTSPVQNSFFPAFGGMQGSCACCLGYNSEGIGSSHEIEFPEKCWEHRTCLRNGGWVEHLRDVAHTRCPIVGCAKTGADFGSRERLLQHWRNKHPGQCYYWGRKPGFFGGEKVVWMRGI